jgi:hypothetical protein
MAHCVKFNSPNLVTLVSTVSDMFELISFKCKSTNELIASSLDYFDIKLLIIW